MEVLPHSGRASPGLDPKPSNTQATFTNFPHLPLEIRRVIWEYAAPNPRHVDGSVVVITNFELARPRIIVPPRRTLPNMFAYITDNDSSSEDFVRPMMQDWSGVLGLLHATHESRNITMKTFRLDCPSSIPEENEPWWNEGNVLYFPRCMPTNIAFDQCILRWMSGIRELPFHHFASIKHIALDFTFEVANSLASDNGHGPVHLFDFADLTTWDYRWLQNFPSLLSLNLLFDPIRVGSFEEGSIKLYEPLDVVVQQFNRTPDELQRMVSARLEQMAQLVTQRLDVPKVECFVMCWKKPRGAKLRWEDYL